MASVGTIYASLKLDDSDFQNKLKLVKSTTIETTATVSGSFTKASDSLTKTGIAAEGLNKALTVTKSIDPVSGIYSSGIMAAKSIDELKDRMSRLKDIMQASEIGSKRFLWAKEEMDATKRRIDEVSGKLKTIPPEMDKVSTRAKFATGSINDLNDKISRLTNIINSSKVDSKRFLWAKEELDIKNKQLDELQSKLGNTKQSIMSLAKDALPALGLSMGILDSIQVGRNFERQMSEVKAASGASKEDLKLLTDEARRLGATTTFSATQAAQGMTELAKAGLNTKQVMQATGDVLNLAQAGGLGLAEATTIAADTMAGFGLQAKDVGRISDVLAKAANSSTISVQDMGESMKYVAGVSKDVGMSLEETSALIAVLGNAGIKGSMAGTTLKTALLSLTGTSKEGEKALAKIGLTMDSFKDRNGNLKNTYEIFNLLAKSTKELGSAEKADVLATVFGKESLSGVLAILSETEKSYTTAEGKIINGIDKMKGEMLGAGGSAKKFGDELTNNLDGAIKNFQSAFEEIKLIFADIFLPIAKPLLEISTLIVQVFGEGLKNSIGIFIPSLKEGSASLSTFIKSLSDGIKEMNPFFKALMGAGATFITLKLGVTGLVSALALIPGAAAPAGVAMTLAFGPVGITIAALTVAIAGITAGLSALEQRQQRLKKEQDDYNAVVATSLKQHQDYPKILSSVNAALAMNSSSMGVNSDISQQAIRASRDELSKYIDTTKFFTETNGKIYPKDELQAFKKELTSTIEKAKDLNKEIKMPKIKMPKIEPPKQDEVKVEVKPEVDWGPLYKEIKTISDAFQDMKKAGIGTAEGINAAMKVLGASMQSFGGRFVQLLQAQGQLAQTRQQNLTQNVEFLTAGLSKAIDNEANAQKAAYDQQLRALEDQHRALIAEETAYQLELATLRAGWDSQAKEENERMFQEALALIRAEYDEKAAYLLANTADHEQYLIQKAFLDEDQRAREEQLRTEYDERLLNTLNSNKEKENNLAETKKNETINREKALAAEKERIEQQKALIDQQAAQRKEQIEKASRLMLWQSGKAVFEIQKQTQMAQVKMQLASIIMSAAQAAAGLTAMTAGIGFGIAMMMNLALTGMGIAASTTAMNAIASSQYPPPPLFADGGIATRPSVFGEAGPELAIPFNNPGKDFGALKGEVAKELVNGKGSVTNIYIDGSKIVVEEQDPARLADIVGMEIRKQTYMALAR